MTEQLPLFPKLVTKFPSTRYQGSKAKLVNWIWDHISAIPFETCLDAFGGTGVVAYRLKQENKHVTYNDNLRFNAWIGRALIENSTIQLTDTDINWILGHHAINYPTFIADTFADIYFTDEENHWLDRVITNIHQIENNYKKSLAFFALAQSCIIKRPYNLFHRKNLYIRTAEVERSFGNKTSWDRPFEDWFRQFVSEGNQAIFDNDQENCANNQDILEIEGNFDLVYLDPPYVSGKGVAVDYRDFYHFLEGLTDYPNWASHIDMNSKHRRLVRQSNDWSDKTKIYSAFERVFEKFSDSIIVVSYRSDGIPSELELVNLLKRYKSNIRVERYRNYQYALSKNKTLSEILLIGQ
jgi:adenine-specific DNA-methyltransferase